MNHSPSLLNTQQRVPTAILVPPAVSASRVSSGCSSSGRPSPAFAPKLTRNICAFPATSPLRRGSGRSQGFGVSASSMMMAMGGGGGGFLGSDIHVATQIASTVLTTAAAAAAAWILARKEAVLDQVCRLNHLLKISARRHPHPKYSPSLRLESSTSVSRTDPTSHPPHPFVL